MIEIPFSPDNMRLYFVFLDFLVEAGMPLAEARDMIGPLTGALMPHIDALGRRLFVKLKANEDYSVLDGMREYQKMLEERDESAD